MTPNLTLEQHLKRFLWLMEEPYRNQFRKECWDEANRLAHFAEFAELPAMLKAAMQSKSTSEASKT
jgi:hypothetical protein